MSSYLRDLPAMFSQDPLLGRVLLAFERVFSDVPGEEGQALLPQQPSLEAQVAQLHTFMRPLDPTGRGRQAPEGFLPWLASWVAVSLREDWDAQTRRRFIQEAIPNYARRGTLAGLSRLLEIYVRRPVRIRDKAEPPEDGGPIVPFPPHYFEVDITIAELDPTLVSRIGRVAKALIDQEKPAHTFYGLRIRTPSLRILNDPIDGSGETGVVIGQTTLLGTGV